MSQSQTSGYDVLVQLSEQELNAQIANAILPINISQWPVTGTLTFNHIEFDFGSDDDPVPPPTDDFVRLVFDLAAYLGGNLYTQTTQVAISAPLAVFPNGLLRQLRIYFNDPVYQTRPDIPWIAGYPTDLPDIVKDPLSDRLRNQIKFYDIGPPIVMSTGSDPLVPSDMNVKVIDDPDPSHIDCVTLMFNTGGSAGGDPAGITHYLGNGPVGAAITLSNTLVLQRLIRPQLAAQLNATFDPPCVLRSPVEIYTGNSFISYINLETMNVFVEGDHLRVVGTIGRSGTGWSVSGAFDVRLDILVNNGVLDIVPTVLSTSAHFSFKWWVWALAGLTAGALGLIIVAVVQFAINKAIASALAKFSALNSALGGGGIALPTIPLGPGGGSLTIQGVYLDDLLVSGPVTRTLGAGSGLVLLGGLHVSHTDSIVYIDGVLATGLLQWRPGSHYVTTRMRAHRGLFSVIASQPVFPATVHWSLAGIPIDGTGMLSIAQSGYPFGVVIDIYYQAEGGHCWIWTPVGSTLVDQPLTATLVDGVGHMTSSTILLSCDGVVVTDVIAHTLAATEVVKSLGHSSGDTMGNAGVSDLPFSSVIDRKVELATAFKAGLANKPVPNAPPKVDANKDTNKK